MEETKNLLEVNDLKMHFVTGSKGLFSKEKNYVYAVDGVNFTIKPKSTAGRCFSRRVPLQPFGQRCS